MKHTFFTLTATAAILLAGISFVNAIAEGPFTLPGTALPELRAQVAAVAGRTDAIDNTKFTYDPSKGTLSTWKDGRHVASADVRMTPSQLPIANEVTINGRIALAIIRGIADRTKTLHPSLLQRERRGDFSISGYDHGTTIVFSENFRSPSYASEAANPRSLDICTPHISYLIDVPSYTIKSLEINYCGGVD